VGTSLDEAGKNDEVSAWLSLTAVAVEADASVQVPLTNDDVAVEVGASVTDDDISLGVTVLAEAGENDEVSAWLSLTAVAVEVGVSVADTVEFWHTSPSTAFNTDPCPVAFDEQLKDSSSRELPADGAAVAVEVGASVADTVEVGHTPPNTEFSTDAPTPAGSCDEQFQVISMELSTGRAMTTCANAAAPMILAVVVNLIDRG